MSNVGRYFLDQLIQTAPVSGTFRKKNGEIRTMKCTTATFLIPHSLKPKDDVVPYNKPMKKRNLDVRTVFDLESKMWKSFRYESIIKIEFLVDAGNML